MFQLRTLAALLGLTSLAAGQIALPATVFDGSGGPLTSGNVYTRSGNLNVPAGETLTIQPGVIVKMNGRFIVDGVLSANGTAEQPLIFTSDHDDSAGGDTDNNGPSSGSPGQWAGLDFSNGSSGSVAHAEIRFGGSGGFSNLYFGGADTAFTFSNVLSRDGSFHGVDFNNHPTGATFTDCSFENNDGWAMADVHIHTVPGFSGNTALGNGFGDSVNVTSTNLLASTNLTADNGLGDTLILRSNPSVDAGETLSFGPGMILKLDGRIVVDGELQVAGTEFAPVIFTSDNDDSVGGDSNGDGPSAGAPGQWSGLDFSEGSSGSVTHAEIRFGGSSGFSNLYFDGADTPIALNNVLSRDGSFHGVDFNNHASSATITDCRFENNNGWAMADVHINTVSGFSGNTAVGNGSGDSVNVTSTNLIASTSLTADNGLGSTLILRSNPSVDVGETLSFGPGMILKLDGRIVVDGDLQVAGTALAPVIFTSDNDDSVGGDSNGDGPSVGAPGQWSGLDFSNGSTGSVSHAEIRFGGSGGFSNLYFDGADTPIALINVLSRDSSFHGIDFNHHASTATLVDCSFENNGGVALQEVHINTVPGFSGLSASGNASGDAVRVTSGTVIGEVTIAPENGLDDVLLFANAANVPLDTTLRVEAGTVMKQGGRLLVSGTLEIAGSVKRPVVITSDHDDSFGGDSNGDGPGAGAPGDHQGLDFGVTANGAVVQNLLVRYSGSGGFAGVTAHSADVSLDQVRVEHCNSDGFRFNASVLADELVAFDCPTGFDLAAGSATITRSTAAGCFGAGMLGSPSFTGSVASSLAGDNSIDWSGFLNASVTYSAGNFVPAGTGNVASAPTFVDSVAGDLRLALGSVGIDGGDEIDFLTITGQDQGGYGRLMDGDLDGNKRVDMGAHEFNNLDLVVTGDASPGGSLDFDLQMAAPFEQTFMFFGLAPFEYNVGRYGSLFVNLFGPHVIMIWPLPPTKVTLDIPLDAVVPTDLFIQAGGRLMRSGAAAGNLSNPVCVTVE